VPSDGGPAGIGADARDRWLSFDDLRRVFREVHAKHVMVALDCCHAGAAFRGRRPRSDTAMPGPRVVTEHLRRRAHVLLCSALGSELASDGSGEHSPFAVGFLRALDAAAAGTAATASQVYVEVVKELQAQDVSQCSWRRSVDSADAEFVFLKRP